MHHLQVSHIGKTYLFQGQPTAVLEDVSLHVQPYEFVTLIGPSGCGKSTLLELMGGLVKPNTGSVSLGNEDVTSQPGFIAYMPQDDTLLPWLTIWDNVVLPLQIQGNRISDARKEITELFELFGLKGYEHAFPYSLSGGMRQRAAFLRTFVGKKDVMLLDEPFARLDALTRGKMQKWLMNIWRHFQSSMVMVTHDIEEAIWMSDRVYVMSSMPGRIIEEKKIPFPKVREESMKYSAEFQLLKQELISLLGN